MKKLLLSLLSLMALTVVAHAADVTIYYDNSGTQWSNVKIHYWSNPFTSWPGVDMQQVDDNVWAFTFPSDPSALDGLLFHNGNGDKTDDYKKVPVNNHIYKGVGGKGPVTDMGEYSGTPFIKKPVVTASPKSGSRFSESITVTFTVSPAATIYYTLDGTEASASSTPYNTPISLTETTTINTYAVTAEGGANSQSFTYTKRNPTPPQTGNTLNTEYYQVNPGGKVGTNRTVNAKFTKLNNDNRMCVADNALSNWSEEDLICQGVARDIASAFRGKHEYPVVDSYAIYASYDKDNLYLGVQYVYAVWDLYGDGKDNNFRAKPYQMDGRLMLAFDLDPDLEFDGVLENGNTIWDADGQYNTFANGTDCILLCSTKSTSGTPGLFFPTPDGKASYGSEYCKSIPAPFYGCQDGLLPSIKHIWGQAEFEYDPEDLKTNDGFVDLIDEIETKYHTFYEWKLPLDKLGITEEYIKNTGIGVMVIDTYGQGATGCTPYDPTVFDNALTPYSKDNSSSAEKEDKDTFTYAHARIGKLQAGQGVINITDDNDTNAPVEYYNIQGIRVTNPQPGNLYIKRQGTQASKVIF
ncbi:MAG: chitobiase/beta-hexosaminidase C-terminal domain-containing protein [Muribaculaceae bacterium]|nr:chitobiase/beta-hexosaminidase C-terminal domain-containing protein [Muribaculaceae bacterium]